MRKPFNGEYRLTQEWGVNPDVYKQFNLKGHNGTDWGLPNGTEVVAPHNGKVLEVAFDSTGYGNYIKIESGLEGSVLAHLQSFKVKVGDTVNEGQVVALSDNTGFSTGAHLHWGYYRIPRNRQDGFLGFINPFPYLLPLPTQPTDFKILYEATKKELDQRDKEKREWESRFYDLEKKYNLLDEQLVKERARLNGARSATVELCKIIGISLNA